MTTYTAELEAVDLARFQRFWNQFTRNKAPRLEVPPAGDGDDYGAAWYIYGYGLALGWLDVRAPRADGLIVRLNVDESEDEIIPRGEPDDPEPWQERRVTDWIVSSVGAWLKYHFGADLVAQDAAAGFPGKTPAPDEDQAGEPAGDETLPGLIDKQLDDWYRWLLQCKPRFGNGDMSWGDIGRRFSVDGRTAKRRLAKLQKRNLPGLEDWPKRAN